MRDDVAALAGRTDAVGARLEQLAGRLAKASRPA
jgi:hypothetical protein